MFSVTRFIRIAGTHNTVNRVFHAVTFECFHTKKPVNLSDGKISKYLLTPLPHHIPFNYHDLDPFSHVTLMSRVSVPSSNVATIEAKALVIEGVSRSRNALIDGDVKDYDWDSGYTCHQLGSGAIVIQLAQPYIVDSMRYV